MSVLTRLYFAAIRRPWLEQTCAGFALLRRDRVLSIMNLVRVTLGLVSTQYIRRVLVSRDIAVLTKDCKKVPLDMWKLKHARFATKSKVVTLDLT